MIFIQKNPIYKNIKRKELVHYKTTWRIPTKFHHLKHYIQELILNKISFNNPIE